MDYLTTQNLTQKGKKKTAIETKDNLIPSF